MAARLAPATTPANSAGTNFTERFDMHNPGNANATLNRLLTSPIWSETWVAMSRNSGADGV